MPSTRREFLTRVGIALAALAAARCAPLGGKPASAWERLRQPWLDLERLAKDAADYERGEKTRERLVADHRAALDALVQADQLEPAVADEMQLAFAGAAQHVWRAHAPITCYEPMLGPDYEVESSSDLAQQAEALADMAGQASIDPATLAQVQVAIERDIAFLSMPAGEQRALTDAVLQAAGDTYTYPRLSELDMDVPPESIEAARILVQVLLGRQE